MKFKIFYMLHSLADWKKAYNFSEKLFSKRVREKLSLS